MTIKGNRQSEASSQPSRLDELAALRFLDLTGLFWTKRCERIGLAKELGDAEEAVQRGTDRCFIAPD
jgi:hypothetical protein